MGARNFFSAEDKQKILDAVAYAEKLTSGEIRVHLETLCPNDQVTRAIFIFQRLGMHQTALRNGVLFYLAVKEKKLAIIADEGINAAVPKGFWDEVRDLMVSHFKEGDYTTGLCEGIRLAGEQLLQHFPRQSEDVNELNDEITFQDSL